MAAPSIAALYPKPGEHSSAKSGPYSLLEIKRIVAHSGAPPTVVAVTLAALSARGDWPAGDGPATTTLCVALKGIMLDSVPSCCRRTAQRRIQRALKDRYWHSARSGHSWINCPKCGKERKTAKCEGCGYRGRSKDASGKWTGEFMIVPTYEFDVEKFRHAPRCKELRHFEVRTYAEYKSIERGKVREFPRKPVQPDPTPPAPAAPAVPVKQPAAEHAHRNPARPEVKPKLTKTEAAKLVADLAEHMRGHTRHVERVGGFGFDLDPSDPRYRPKMNFDEALKLVCERWNRSVEAVRESLKFYGFTHGERADP